jgi:hypothetical protein
MASLFISKGAFYTITVHDLANDQLKVRNNSMGAIAQDNF